VKQSPRLAHIPVVLLTGAFEPVDQARATEMGCDGVLAKPFEPQLVIGRVKELLGRARGASGRPAAGPQPGSLQAGLAEQLFGSVAVPAGPAPAPKADLNNYFDRLDQAFADLTTAPAATSAPSEPAAPDVDWFKTVSTADRAPVPEKWDLPDPPPGPEGLSPQATALPDFDRLAAATMAPVPVEAPLPVMPPPPAAAPASSVAAAAPSPLPPLADAFAALLSAEQNAGSPLKAPQWPGAIAPAPAPPAGPAEITDEVVEEVVRRVLARMSDTIVRERVSVMVSDIAERLVRQEIERIKASIQ
jgi:CheY-like chemotaxis protein